ncbi:MAG: DUF3568 family protein [Verrucomicrobiota bacterium]
MKKKSLVLSLFAFVAILFAGCTTPVAIDPQTGQDQTASYKAGYFYGPLEADSSVVFKTAIRELDDLGYFRTGELHKNTFINIYARKVGDKKVNVRISQVGPGQSQLRVRVGTLGNLAESQVIYARIRDAL